MLSERVDANFCLALRKADFFEFPHALFFLIELSDSAAVVWKWSVEVDSMFRVFVKADGQPGRNGPLYGGRLRFFCGTSDGGALPWWLAKRLG